MAFRRAYRERFGDEPGFPDLTAINASRLALDVLAERSTERRKQALLAHGAFVGAQSQTVFDANGNTLRDTFLSVIPMTSSNRFASGLPGAPFIRQSQEKNHAAQSRRLL